jgi:hypothetical protein
MSMFEEALKEARDIIEYQRWCAPPVPEGGMTEDMAVEVERSLLAARDVLDEVIEMAATARRQVEDKEEA